MSTGSGLFLEACGAAGPVSLAWDDPVTGERQARAFDRPVVLVGRNLEADLVLDHPSVGLRHAYMQLVDGRLFAVDLGSRGGLSWGGVPRPSGWVDRSRPVRIGTTTVEVTGEGAEPGADPGPRPTSRRFVSRRALPDVWLEVREGDEKPRRVPFDRPLLLVGQSEHCQLRLGGPETSRFACGLVLTPRGVWMVDLLSSRGVTVNGAVSREARLEDGDQVGVGDQVVRVLYAGSSGVRGSAGVATLATRAASEGVLATGGAPSVEAVLLPFLDPEGPALDGPSSSPGPALMMVLQLMGNLHRENLELVRGELREIRRLGREMTALKAQLLAPDRPADGSETAPAPAVPLLGPGPGPPPVSRAPMEVRHVASQKLADWERERQGRWRHILALLGRR